MADASPEVDGHESKRRKVRKGTQSCWECRRRKVRCIFAAPADAICKNCSRRGTACNSQELPDEPMLYTGSSNQVDARLGRVEKLIEHLVNSPVTARIPSALAKDLLEDRLTDLDDGPLASRISDQYAGIPTPDTFDVDDGASFTCSDRNIVHVTDSAESTHPKRPSHVTANSPTQRRRTEGKYDELSRTLTAAWPSQRDIELICTLPVGLSAHLHSGICTPYSSSMDWDPPSPREMLQLPPPGSHPVLIARQLLVLATYLQAVPPSSIQDLEDQGISYGDVMSHVVDTARLVTTNEDLISSVEGIDCVMIESMYQNYAGNLHRSWMAVRRAITVAQMMELHRGFNSPSLKILTPETRAVFNADQICFRLAEMDRYLSLMLGLQRSSLEARFAAPKALEGCQPIDRMQRIHCAMADNILQRNENNLSETHDIDMLLEKVANEMPPQWWLIPNLSARNSDGIEVLHEAMRLMTQFSHYHLLIRLHLPYMLRSSPDNRYDHSKITAVNISREVLARFIAFRTSNTANFYCRGTDFLTFIATAVLCHAHIDSRCRRDGATQTSESSTTFNFLAHSRPSDRGMLERTLDIMESVALSGNDAIASKIAGILRHLLAIEANAARGISYNINSSKGDDEAIKSNSNLTNADKGLKVHIPSFGTINFERRTISKSRSKAPSAPELGLPTTIAAENILPDLLGVYKRQLPSSLAASPASEIVSQSDYYHVQNLQLQSGQPAMPQHPSSVGDSFPGFSNGASQEWQLPSSVGIVGTENDWDLQGVDLALFNSLFQGWEIPDAVEEETWAQWASNG